MISPDTLNNQIVPCFLRKVCDDLKLSEKPVRVLDTFAFKPHNMLATVIKIQWQSEGGAFRGSIHIVETNIPDKLMILGRSESEIIDAISAAFELVSEQMHAVYNTGNISICESCQLHYMHIAAASNTPLHDGIDWRPPETVGEDYSAF